MAFQTLPLVARHSESDQGPRSPHFCIPFLGCIVKPQHNDNSDKDHDGDIFASPSQTATTIRETIITTFLSQPSTTSHSAAPTPPPTSAGDVTTASLHKTGTISPSSNDPSSKFSSKSLDSTLTSFTNTIPSGSSSQRESGTTIVSNNVSIFAPFNSDPEPASSSTSTPVTSSSPHKGVDVGAIVGGILGALVILLLIFYAIVLLRRRKRYGAPSAEFLDWSFQRGSPSVGENTTSYPFGSAHATTSHNRSSTTHTTTTIGRGFRFPPLKS